MAYQKQTFIDNKTVLKAEHLEHIENGIVAIEEALVGGALESLAIQAGRGITINGETSNGSSGGNTSEDPFGGLLHYLLNINAPEHFLSIKEHFLFGRKTTLINDCSISPS